MKDLKLAFREIVESLEPIEPATSMTEFSGMELLWLSSQLLVPS